MSNFPYPGLRPFKQDETDIFFGREEHIQRLLTRLESTHFLAVVGHSGCGKSSLIHTGLLAKLTTDDPTKSPWCRAQLRPGNRPFENLAKALLDDPLIGPGYLAKYSDYADALFFLQTNLRRDSLSLHFLLQEIGVSSSHPLLIIIDQFEEIFRFYQQIDENEAQAFVALLLENCRLDNIYVIITMRSDFLGECTFFPELPEAINQSIFLVPRLTREQLQAAIERPAQVFGGEIELALTIHLLDEASNDSDQLPLLQHALMRMWNLAREENPQQIILTLRHYEMIGGQLTAALSQHADETYEELGTAQYKIAEILFRNLTELSNDHRDARRPIELRSIAEQANVPWERIAAVVEMFRQAGRCFITPGEGSELKPNTILDISHESLIREWQRLKNWAKNEAVSAALYQRLELDARLWEQGEAELWRGLNLNNALVWRNLERPNKAWARRYGKNFDLAMRFLDTSQAKQNDELKQAETIRERELQRQRIHRQAIWSLVGLIVVTILALFEFFQWQYAVEAQARAETAQHALSSNLFESHLTHASLLAKVENYALTKQIVQQTYEFDAKVPPPRRHARNLVSWFGEVMGSPSQKSYEGMTAQLSPVALSPDGHLLATGGENGSLALFDTESGRLLKKLKGHHPKREVKAIVFHPQGQWLASAGNDKRIIFWNLTSGEPLFEWSTPSKIKALAVLPPDGKYLASGGEDNNITIWEVSTGKIQKVLAGHTESISEGGLAFSHSGKWLASGSYDDTARLWSVETGQTIYTLKGHSDDVGNVLFSPNDQFIFTSSDDKSIRRWDTNTGQPVFPVLYGHQNRVTGLGLVENGRYLVSTSFDRTLRVWDIESGSTLRVLQGHLARIIGLVTYNNQAFSASGDGSVKRWNISLPYQQLVDFKSLEARSVAIAPDGHSVAVGFAEGGLRLYSLPNIRLLWEQDKAHEKVEERLSLAFSPNSELLASSGSNTVKLWKVEDGSLLQVFDGHQGVVNAVDFSPDGQVLATASDDGQIGLFKVGTKQKRFIKDAHSGKYVLSVAFDANGTRLLSSGRDEQPAKLWDLTTSPPTPLQAFSHAKGIRWAAISPDNQRIASVGRDQLIHLYTLPDGREQRRLIGHEQTVFRAIFSPDSQQLATAGGDATIRLWDLKSSNELFALHLPTQVKSSSPLWDFDFRCTHRDCWIAVPLTRGKLVLYELGQIYN